MPAQDKVGQWKSKRESKVTLPSGTVVTIAVPNLPELLRAGSVPNELVKHLTEAQDTIAGVNEWDIEMIKETTDFMRWVIATTVKEPVITPDDVPELPTLDQDCLLEIAMRQRDRDAVGHHLHGLEKVADWRRFRDG